VGLVERELTEAIIGATYAVHNGLGSGSPEIRKACNRAAKVRGNKKKILLIPNILLILSYWNIAMSIQMPLMGGALHVRMVG